MIWHIFYNYIVQNIAYVVVFWTHIAPLGTLQNCCKPSLYIFNIQVFWKLVLKLNFTNLHLEGPFPPKKPRKTLYALVLQIVFPTRNDIIFMKSCQCESYKMNIHKPKYKLLQTRFWWWEYHSAWIFHWIKVMRVKEIRGIYFTVYFRYHYNFYRLYIQKSFWFKNAWLFVLHMVFNQALMSALWKKILTIIFS